MIKVTMKFAEKSGIFVLAALLFLCSAISVHAKPCSSAKGFPVRGVNNINLNLYITDIPLWYTPQVGPEVSIQISYNSQAAVVPGAPFGNKWQFNYQGSLTVSSDSVTVTMPDGRVDVYTGTSTFTAPTGVFSTLTGVGGNRYELKLTSGEVYVYDVPSGTTLTNPVLVQMKDAYGNALAFGYNGANQLATITDAQQRVTTVEYTGGRITKVTDPFGRSATFGYTDNELASITDMGGYVAEMSYQANPHDNNVYIATLTNKGLNGTLQPAETTTFLIEPNDGPGVTLPGYPAPGSPMLSNYRVTITSPPVEGYPNGAKEEYYYYGAYTWYVSPRDYVEYVDGDTNNFRSAAKTIYYLDRADPKGKITKVKRPEGGYVEYGNFDPVTGQAQTVTDYHGLDSANSPITHSVAYTFNDKGNVTSVTPARSGSAVTTMTYYPNNIDLQSIYNGLGTVSFTYNGDTHDVKTVTDRLGVVTEYGYDATGKLIGVTRAKGTAVQSVTELVYDSTTRNLTGLKQNGEIVSSFTYGDQSTTPPGRVETATDASGVTLGYRYDNLDRVTAVTYPDTVYSGAEPTAKYQRIDYSGCCTQMVGSVTDRAGRTTAYTHDALKRITQINGLEGIFKFSYDGNGNLIKRIDANNNETRFEYNLDNRRTKKIFADGRYVVTAYDKAGLPKTFTNSRNIVKSYTFDANHNLSNISYSDSTPGITNTYDAYDRLQTRTDGTGLTTFGYDANSRLKTVDGPWDSDLITYAYNELGDLKSVTPVTGQVVTYTYDYESTDAGIKKVGRLVKINRGTFTGTDTFTYGYSGVSPLIQNLTRPNGSVTEYQYDSPLKKLTALINKKSTAEIITSYLYEYNDADLIFRETITNGEPITEMTTGVTNFTSNILNQTTSATGNRTYLYDEDGNMTQGYTPDGYVLTMAYDAENRMKNAEYADTNSIQHRTDYIWGGDSLLAEEKKYQNGALTLDTRYLRAGFLPVQERDAANAITREYTWGLNLGGGIGGLLNLRQSGQDYAYLYDGKGNVTAVIDGTQSLATAYAYSAFGILLKKRGTLEQRYMFSTKEYDAGTGLYNYGHRSYMPVLAKWTTKDPLEEAGGVNLYGFVDGNPVNWVDPWGLSRYDFCEGSACEKICKKIVDYACSKAPAHCCKVDFDSCIAGLDTEAKDFAHQYKRCSDDYLHCISKSSRTVPDKPNWNGRDDRGYGDPFPAPPGRGPKMPNEPKPWIK